MKFPVEFISSSEQDTKSIAESFAADINPGDVICLNGELGCGKTFFVKAICKQFGIHNASSPSFSIVNEYSGKFKIYHFDFYRLKSVKELYDIGFEDYLLDEDAVIGIEWAELFPEILPLKRYDILFDIFEVSKRRIIIKKSEP
ncbi:MAG: tRNA (adenosine(37)-N6)-threonylcarbamoyltransferase complex ATPase subunit type 1 TsaE [Ignavibacteriales bacterium CG_4_9_14_3_um_filter_34_10]|nr:MAG: tRNA (adenosine(37)-N6)-threonylcarbamoyltransferase complex ATPase subunit type 1 TsaE [Ignavibacteriales bacterium CG_4_9_14_3_um_filter_34_10]